jgi:hypothetical protein
MYGHLRVDDYDGGKLATLRQQVFFPTYCLFPVDHKISQHSPGKKDLHLYTYCTHPLHASGLDDAFVSRGILVRARAVLPSVGHIWTSIGLNLTPRACKSLWLVRGGGGQGSQPPSRRGSGPA